MVHQIFNALLIVVEEFYKFKFLTVATKHASVERLTLKLKTKNGGGVSPLLRSSP
jgi:hypothetical protein